MSLDMSACHMLPDEKRLSAQDAFIPIGRWDHERYDQVRLESGSGGITITISATGDGSLIGTVLEMKVEVKLDKSLCGDCLLIRVAMGSILVIGFVDGFFVNAGKGGLAGTPSQIAANGDAFCGSVTLP
jgi:hypothetical protein